MNLELIYLVVGVIVAVAVIAVYIVVEGTDGDLISLLGLGFVGFVAGIFWPLVLAIAILVGVALGLIAGVGAVLTAVGWKR